MSEPIPGRAIRTIPREMSPEDGKLSEQCRVGKSEVLPTVSTAWLENGGHGESVPTLHSQGIVKSQNDEKFQHIHSHPASALKGEESNLRFLLKGEPLTVLLEGKEQSADSPTMTGGSGRRLPSPGWNVERESLYPRRLPSRPLNPVSFCPWSSVPARIGTGSAVHRNSGKEPERP